MKKLFLLLGVAVLATGLFTSCDYENPQDYETVLLPYFVQIYQRKSTPPDGLEIGHGYLEFICADSTAEDGLSEMQFISMGKGKSVNKITAVPADGWQSDSIPSVQNTGYLIRYHKHGTEGWLYRRLYIKQYILLGGEDWYGKIQYDKRDWNPLTNY